MTSRDFCYWLQGYFEISMADEEYSERNGLTYDQQCVIKKHLAMVFLHEIDPSFGDNNEALDRIHNGQTLDEAFKKVEEYWAANPQFDPRKVYEEGEPRLKC